MPVALVEFVAVTVEGGNVTSRIIAWMATPRLKLSDVVRLTTSSASDATSSYTANAVEFVSVDDEFVDVSVVVLLPVLPVLFDDVELVPVDVPPLLVSLDDVELVSGSDA